MKKQLLTLLLMFWGLICLSQTEPQSSILGITFGSSKEKMMQIMKSKGYTLKLTAQKNPAYSKVKFGAFSNCEVVFYFVNNKMFQSLIILDDGLEATAIERYEYLTSEISKKYGKGESFKTFKPPYEDGDGYEVSAIKIGKAEYNTFWNIDDLAINTYITPSLLICIKYQDAVLVKEALKVKDDKNLTEY